MRTEGISASAGRSVALVEWHWVGHHPLYYKQFVRTLLELGCHVLALCPNPAEVTAFLTEHGVDRQRLEIEAFHAPPARRGIAARTRDRLLGATLFRAVRRRIRAWEQRATRAVDLVFFACIYESDFKFFPHTRSGWPYRWSGLYLQADYLRDPGKLKSRDLYRSTQAALHDSRLASLAVLDEGIAERLEREIGHPVVLLPDFTDATVDSADAMARRLQEFAKGAPIVGILGHLFPNKGIVTLAKLALDPAFLDVCFAFIGDLPLASFSEEDRNLLGRLQESSNSFRHFERVDSERAFNAAIAACDVVFAAYIDFPHSSNILTKAGFLEKPLIVSDGGLMAERVREFRMGAVVRQEDVSGTGEAVRRLMRSGPGPTPRWADFRARYGTDTLRTAFGRILG